jgi:hypothetical protein
MDIRTVSRENLDQLLGLYLMAEFVVDGVGPADYILELRNSVYLNAV